MTKKIFCLTLALLFVLNATAFADTKKTRTKAAQGNQLLALLPASDGAAALDVQRLLNEAAPQMLAANPAKLNEFNRVIEDVKSKTGLDLRQFEQIAVGFNLKPNGVEPLVLARGKYNAAALLAAVKLGTKGKYREEKIGDRSVYVFSIKEITADHQAKVAGNSMLSKVFNTVFKNMPDELAVTTFDAKTLTVGSPARVREIFETKTRIGAGVLALVNRKPNAIMSFGANTPNGLKGLIDLDDDEIGRTLAAVRQISGAMDVSAGNANVTMNAKTLDAAQAESLESTLVTMQALGKGLLGGMGGKDKKVYAKMVENLKITRAGTQIALDLQIPQTDINVLLGAK
jgi:hypothetical protein